MSLLPESKRLSGNQIIEAGILTGILIALLGLLYIRLSFGSQNLFFKELLNDGHLVIFAGISYVILRLWNLRRRSLWA
ncbi:MAG: hypothetical protein ONB05_10105, partial [candidate division KSB1 bacterium]|nr:hypothetical protein [candidate division KSB1 bacterium]